MIKTYEKKLIELAKEVSKTGDIKLQLLDTKENHEASQKLTLRDNKINFLLGFILALEEE